MQFSRYITYSKNDSSYRLVSWAIKIAIALGSLYYVISKLFTDGESFTEIGTYLMQPVFYLVVFIVVVLMSINWWFEVLKWKLIAKPFKELSTLEASKAVIAGVAMDSVLPFGTGAIAGKVLSIKNHNRVQLVMPVAIAQGLQTFWTILFGLIGLFQLAKMTSLSKLYVFEEWQWIVGGLVLLVVVTMTILWPTIFRKWMVALKGYKLNTWVAITGFSLLRYLVFLSQLLLLAYFMNYEIPFSVLLGCSTWMFFAKTIVPKPGHLGALGIRGAAAVFFLSLAGYHYTGFVMATFILWVINLALPTLLGIFFIKELNLSTDS